jgi:ribonuclease BN (tRNA processing enzyme)
VLQTEQTTALLDCGATSLVALKVAGIDPGSIDTVLLSHLHGDHFGGLPFLILDGQFSRRTAGLTIIGPPGTQDRLQQAMEVLYPGSTGIERRFEVTMQEMAPGGVAVAEGIERVAAFAADHAAGAPALMYRLEIAGVTVAYTGDTAWMDEIVPLASAATLLIAEGYSFERKIRYHLDFATLRQHLPELGCGRTVLTHMSSDMLGREPGIEGVTLAADGLRIALG